MIEKPFKNQLVLEWTRELLTNKDKSSDLIILLDFYLKKYISEDEIDLKTSAEMVRLCTEREYFENSLHQVYIWSLFKTVLSHCKNLVDLKAYFKDSFGGADGRFV